MRLLVLGINPSERSHTRMNSAWNRLQRWIDELGIRHCHEFTNVILFPGEYRQDKVDLRTLANLVYGYDAVITLGNFPLQSLRRMKYQGHYYMLPHPSYRNRQLNDPDYEAAVLEDCKRWIASMPARNARKRYGGNDPKKPHWQKRGD